MFLEDIKNKNQILLTLDKNIKFNSFNTKNYLIKIKFSLDLILNNQLKNFKIIII